MAALELPMSSLTPQCPEENNPNDIMGRFPLDWLGPQRQTNQFGVHRPKQCSLQVPSSYKCEIVSLSKMRNKCIGYSILIVRVNVKLCLVYCYFLRSNLFISAEEPVVLVLLRPATTYDDTQRISKCTVGTWPISQFLQDGRYITQQQFSNQPMLCATIIA